MNFYYSKYGTSICSSSNNKFFKKFKRKRRKNKFKNSTVKKKNQKQFATSNGAHSSDKFKSRNLEFNKSRLRFDNKIFMSDWYWSNYKKAFEWQGKHSLAYWKSCALALQEENRYLLQIIHSLQSNKISKLPAAKTSLGDEYKILASQANSTSSYKKGRNYETSENSENDEFEFEMSEEMIKYFEQSFKHKMTLEKEKEENELQDMDKKVKEIQETQMKRASEMKLLYGDDASKIIGMETAIQLSYDKYCDNKSPKYWPNIPFRL